MIIKSNSFSIYSYQQHNDLKDSKDAKIPLGDFNVNVKSDLYDIESTQKIIGCLQYIANRSRPDIAASVNILSSKMHEPTKHIWDLMINI